MKAIIESGNDYLLTVKQNQPKLHRQLQQNAQSSEPIDTYSQTEKTRNRTTTRMISVFTNLTGINQAWQGISCFVKVERSGWRKDIFYQETHYYLTSLATTGQRLASLIRGKRAD